MMTALLAGSISTEVIAGDNQVVVVANKYSQIRKLSKEQVQYLYTGKMTDIGNGSVIIPLDVSGDDGVKKDFYKFLLNTSPQKMSAYWAQLVFTGQATPPHKVYNESSVLQIVSKNKYAIGYVYKTSTVGKDYKVLFTLP